MFVGFLVSSSLIAHNWQTCVALASKRQSIIQTGDVDDVDGVVLVYNDDIDVDGELDGSATTAQKSFKMR